MSGQVVVMVVVGGLFHNPAEWAKPIKAVGTATGNMDVQMVTKRRIT